MVCKAIPKDLSLLLSTSQLGSSTSRAFAGHIVFGDFAGHALSGAAEQQGNLTVNNLLP